MIMNRNLFQLTLALLLAIIPTTFAYADEAEKQPAFPGAEGFGRYVTGGRGGKVYHVTTLDDGTSEGTFRYACNQSGARTIVFDVSGTIHLTSALKLANPNVTIAGQSAPGDGICIADYPFSINTNNVIIRYMRFRLGNKNVTLDGADGWDGLGALDKENIIVDHCSVSWSIDECLSFGGCKNTTVQWCLVSQSLRNAGHSKGAHGYGGNWGGSGASYHHNLLAHHGSRTPRLGPRYTTQNDERMDMRNNVIYNFGGNGCYGGEAMKVNIVNNYYKPGAATKKGAYQYRIAGLGIRTSSYITSYPAYEPTLHVWGKYYVDGNYNPNSSLMNNDNWTYGIYNQIDASSNDGLYNDDVKDSIRLSEPIDFILTTTHSAETAYERVLSYAGASLHRDALDEVMVNDTRNKTCTYPGSDSNGLIDSQDELGDSPWPTLNSEAAKTDSDGDGMPDEWETANGLDPNDGTDGARIADDGYTYLEHYLNSIVADITAAQAEGGTEMGSIVSSGLEEGETLYTISDETYIESNPTTTWNFNGGFSISNAKSKTYAVGKNYCIKFSSNVQFTISIPDGLAVTSIKIYGYDNYTDVDSYLGELNGTTYDSSLYLFPQKDADGNFVYKEYTIDLATPATGTLTFTPKGKQVVWKFELTTSATTGINTLKTDALDANNVYTLSGVLVKRNATSADIQALPAGVYISGGKKIVVAK